MKHRVALIGCGGMAKNHVVRFEELYNRLEVAAIVDIDVERARSVAEMLPNKPLVSASHLDAIPVCDAALLVLPHQLHCDYTLDFLNAGKHILVEKPMANTEAECLRMIDAAKSNRKVLMVAYCMRFHPLIRKMRELIANETYGKTFQLSIWTEQYTEYPEGHWSRSADQLGGGQLFSHGCHYIDLMLWMMGEPVIGSHVGTNLGTPWMEREGTSNVTMKFANGACGYHFGTWGARGSRLKYSFQAHCEKGMLEVAFQDGKLFYHGNLNKHTPGQEEKCNSEVLLETPAYKSTTAEMAHFLDCIETGELPLTDAESSLEGLRVIWELYKAEDENRLANLSGIVKNFK